MASRPKTQPQSPRSSIDWGTNVWLTGQAMGIHGKHARGQYGRPMTLTGRRSVVPAVVQSEVDP